MNEYYNYTQVYKIGGVLPHLSKYIFLEYFDVLSPEMKTVLAIQTWFWLSGG